MGYAAAAPRFQEELVDEELRERGHEGHQDEGDDPPPHEEVSPRHPLVDQEPLDHQTLDRETSQEPLQDSEPHMALPDGVPEGIPGPVSSSTEGMEEVPHEESIPPSRAPPREAI